MALVTADEWTEIGKPHGFTRITPLYDPQGAGYVLHMTFMSEYEGKPFEKVWFATYRPDAAREERIETVQLAATDAGLA